MAQIARTAFETSRLLDFFSTKELTAQIGHGVPEWPLVVVKELFDNAIDACEEAGIAPELELFVDRDSMIVADNGPGIPARVIEGVLDFSIRVSSREAYIAPTRGQQGNALKTIVPMPFVLSGDVGKVEITSQSVHHEIQIAADRIRQQPRVSHQQSPSEVKTGTIVKVHMGDCACRPGDWDRDRFLLCAQGDLFEVSTWRRDPS